jgi:hypothetical protein
MLIAALCGLATAIDSAFAQGTAFTYQGKLSAGGAPANGTYDLQFTILDGTNIPGNVISGPLIEPATGVTNGLFTVTLDFGPGVFNGNARWLEIAVRTNGGTTLTALSPRQPLTPAPYAILAGDVTSANIARLTLTGTTTPATGVPVIDSGFVVRATVTSGGSGYVTPPSVTLGNTGGGSGAIITANISSGRVLSFTVLDAGFGYSPATTLTVGVPPSDAYQVFAGANYFSGVNTLNNPGNTIAGSFTGNGAGLTNVIGTMPWQTVAGTSVQAVPNTGYLLTNAQLVSVTLPASPSPGDIVRVSGVGAGGWRIAQNTGQLILTDTISGQSFNTVASSSDGTRLVAAGFSPRICISTNSGAIWAPTSSPITSWSSVALSSDGSKLVAAAGLYYTSGPLYVSLDMGASWTATSAPITNWASVASSLDGSKLVAAAGGGNGYVGPIYTSANSGATWAPSSAPSLGWSSVACSSDGSKLVAAARNGSVFTTLGSIYASTNSGTTWTPTSAPSNSWSSVASSSDGSKLVATVSGGLIYTSANSGATWTPTSAPSNSWNSVASSSDGSKLVAVVSGGLIYTSANSGATWTPTSAPSAYWSSVAISSDGSKFVAVGGGLIYTPQGSGQMATTSGAFGYLTGGQSAAIELQYIGNGQFKPLSFVGTITPY